MEKINKYYQASAETDAHIMAMGNVPLSFFLSFIIH